MKSTVPFEPSRWGLQGAEHRSLLFRILFLADSVQIRALMGANSLVWAWSLIGGDLMHFLFPSVFGPSDVFDRAFYADMHAFAPAWLWAAAYATHGFGAWWRILDREERVLPALLINGWGVVVWGWGIFCQLTGTGHWAPSVTADLGSTFMLLCAFVSSGWNRSSTST